MTKILKGSNYMIREKILSFIINDENKLLLLKGNDTDPELKKSIWYVVTGSVENYDKNFEEAVKREIKEETNLDVIKLINMNWTFRYDSLEGKCIEHAYISKVNNGNIILNFESIDYEWLDYDEFIEKIDWFYTKDELKIRLKEAISKILVKYVIDK